MKINSRLRPAHGFTLLELVVVVGVLVILAGFVLPKFDVFKLKANKGVAAANMSGISRLIQQYYAQNSIYPDGWDSLLTTANPGSPAIDPTEEDPDGTPAVDPTPEALWKPEAPGGAPGLDPQLVGGPPVESPTKLAQDTLDEKEVRSLTRIGITTLYDTTASGAPNDSFTAPRSIADGAKVAVVNSATSDGQAIISHIYPGRTTVPTGKKLVVFGLGSRSSMLGQIMQEVPFYPNTDQVQYYSRYLVIFQVSNGGSRAELKAVVGSDGDLIKEEIADYYER